jgi:phosphoribosylglycinamide formyltransferase-1
VLKVGILASGEGTNFQALSDACDAGYAPAVISVVLCNRAQAGVLRRAERAGVEAVFVDPSAACSREEYDRMLMSYLDKFEVDLVCGAGYMRLLSADFVRSYENRILNVHPSLLPSFPGLHSVRQALEWGAKTTGVTVHVIDRELDHGPIVCQRALDVLPGDTLQSLETRVHLVEYALYPKALKLWAEGRVHIEGRRALIDGDVEDPPWTGERPPGLRS